MLSIGMRVQIVKKGHTFEGAKGKIVSIGIRPNGAMGYIEIELDWEEDWKGGNGRTFAKGRYSLKELGDTH